MNMRRADKTLIVLAVCLLALSCATGCKVDPGADVILVNAERGAGAESRYRRERSGDIDYDNVDTMRQTFCRTFIKLGRGLPGVTSPATTARRRMQSPCTAPPAPSRTRTR
jgi:hypothetical protein